MSQKYDEYLEKHRQAVKKAYQWIAAYIPELTDVEATRNIEFHDMSKNTPDEYTPYDNYFYGEQTPAIIEALNRAWLKFMRMITVYLDITAPLYWWKEFDTYKVGTVANSCSTMHKIAAKEFTLDDFSHEHLVDDLDVRIEIGGTDHRDTGPMEVLGMTIDVLNHYREKYLAATKTEEYTGLPAKDIWWQMIQLLPSSYNQKRTVMLNYEVLANIYKSRRHHKLDEWHTLCDRIESLPYSALITGTAV